MYRWSLLILIGLLKRTASINSHEIHTIYKHEGIEKEFNGQGQATGFSHVSYGESGFGQDSYVRKSIGFDKNYPQLEEHHYEHKSYEPKYENVILSHPKKRIEKVNDRKSYVHKGKESYGHGKGYEYDHRGYHHTSYEHEDNGRKTFVRKSLSPKYRKTTKHVYVDHGNHHDVYNKFSGFDGGHGERHTFNTDHNVYNEGAHTFNYGNPSLKTDHHAHEAYRPSLDPGRGGINFNSHLNDPFFGLNSFDHSDEFAFADHIKRGFGHGVFKKDILPQFGYLDEDLFHANIDPLGAYAHKYGYFKR